MTATAAAPLTNNATRTFLESLFGSDLPGYLNIWNLPDKHSFFTQDIDLAVQNALELARDHHVFFGLGLRKEALPADKRGEAKDVIAIPGFWFDIDIAGPNHKSQNLPKTREEALEFLDSLPWKPSFIIFSGSGIHAYFLFKELWVFESDWEREKAQELSKRFQGYIINEGALRGWRLDNTANIAWVLRVPGSYNRKQPGAPVLVEILEDHPDRRYSPSDFEDLLPQANNESGREQKPERKTDFPPADIEAIISGCAWMRHCRENAESLPEPEWHSSLSILGRCENGNKIAHDWSRNYPKYSVTETDRKLRHALNDAGPRTCASIALNGGAPYCQACSKGGIIISPIVLGLPKHTDAGAREKSWPEISPLPDLMPVAPIMPLDIIPEPFRRFIGDISDRMQVAPEIPAVAAMAALSAVVGRLVAIYPKQFDSWLVILNLWGLIAARSGMLKSPAIEEALKPLGILERNARQQFEADELGRKADDEIAAARLTALKNEIAKAAKAKNEETLKSLKNDLVELQREADSRKITERRYRINDATTEKLLEILVENPRGLFVYRDELSGLLRSLEKQGRETDRAFYLEAWNGNQPFTTDRIGRGTIHVPALCLSVFGGIQPAKLAAYISDALDGTSNDDGLIQRFQLSVFPEPLKVWNLIDRKPDRDARDRVIRIFEILDTLDSTAIGE